MTVLVRLLRQQSVDGKAKTPRRRNQGPWRGFVPSRVNVFRRSVINEDP